MNKKPALPGYFILLLSLLGMLLLTAPAMAASGCKTLSKSQCSRSDNCSWVSGYKTKKGAEVKPYCRSKAGKSTGKSKSEKKSSSKKSSRQETKKNDKGSSKKKASKGKRESKQEKKKKTKSTSGSKKKGDKKK